MKELTRWQVVFWVAVAAAAFHIAWLVPPLGPLMILFLYALVQLSRTRTSRWAFYAGLAVGVAVYGPQLAFFWNIFRFAAPGLWVLLAMWIGFFVLLARALRRIPWLPMWAWAALLPILWTGMEYFRSELYYLKFAWITPGMAFDPVAFAWLFSVAGTYGIGFLLMAVAAVLICLPRRYGFTLAVVVPMVLALVAYPMAITPRAHADPQGARVIGIQLEHPSTRHILEALDTAVSEHPDVQLLVLSEYTFATPPPQAILDWCKRHERYLIIGGIQPFTSDPESNQWADTAFVIDPHGQIVFTQGKRVPIQFFDDGLPAKTQKLWDSPWGKIGICICYDLSYSRVTDNLVRQGAQLLIVPSMDAISWGSYQHTLHARIAPLRAAEYGIPIVRVSSSGISQIVATNGQTIASASFPGQGEMVAARVLGERVEAPSIPLDRRFAHMCSYLTAAAVVLALGHRFVGKLFAARRRSAALAPA